MDVSVIIENKALIATISTLSGIVVTIITQKILNKRGLFAYYVSHARVGVSADDEIYGSVKVTWNNNPIAHLYLSTIELINQSMKDYDSVTLRIFTNNTNLLTQRTEIVGTTRLIDFTDDYKKMISIPSGSSATSEQSALFRRERDYFVPTMNRGQVLRFQFLNAAYSEEQPTIWVDVLHKGVKCKYKVSKNQVLGVPRSDAAIIGTLVGLILVCFVILYIESLALAAILSFFVGWIAIIPGAYAIKVFRKIKDYLGD